MTNLPGCGAPVKNGPCVLSAPHAGPHRGTPRTIGERARARQLAPAGPGPDRTWMTRAVCTQIDPELWFPERGDRGAAAKEVCGTCPVQPQCLEHALAVGETGDSSGVWGGTTPEERHTLLRQRAFLAHIASIEDDIDERLAAAARLGQEVSAARDTARQDLDDARRQLAAARAMTVLEDCDGCHGRRDAAIDEAEEAIADCETRISICETAGRILQVLRARLIRARARLRAVPADLGETYESVYRLIRSGGHLPYEARWITGDTTTPVTR